MVLTVGAQQELAQLHVPEGHPRKMRSGRQNHIISLLVGKTRSGPTGVDMSEISAWCVTVQPSLQCNSWLWELHRGPGPWGIFRSSAYRQCCIVSLSGYQE